MKNQKNRKKNSLRSVTESAGEERRQTLESGGVWTRPTLVMDEKKKFSRSREKESLYRTLKDHDAL